MYYLVDGGNHLAMIFSDEIGVPTRFKDYPIMEVKELPEGEGILKVDAEQQVCWYDEPQIVEEPIVVPTSPEVSVNAQIDALKAQNDFLEECIVELSQTVYS